MAGPQNLACDAISTHYVALGLGADPAVRPTGSMLGHVLSFTPSGTILDFVDVSSFEALNNPVGGPVDSNPSHIAVNDAGLLATDAGAKAVYSLSALGDVCLIGSFVGCVIGSP